MQEIPQTSEREIMTIIFCGSRKLSNKIGSTSSKYGWTFVPFENGLSGFKTSPEGIQLYSP